MNLSSYALADCSTADIKAYLEHKDIVMIPIASTEQHGPHLPLATDTIGVAGIAPIVLEYFGGSAPAGGDAQPRDRASSASRR